MADPVPRDFHRITPHLTVRGAADYCEFLKRAFGAEILRTSPGPGGKLMHVLARVGDSMLMFGDHFPEFGSPPIAEGHWPLVLHQYLPDVDAAWERAVAAGCKVGFPLADQFWGDRYGMLIDPFGFTWALATHKEDVSEEEMRRRSMAAFGGG